MSITISNNFFFCNYTVFLQCFINSHFFQDRAKSPEIREELEKLLKPFNAIMREISSVNSDIKLLEGFIFNPQNINISDSLGKMIDAIYKGVNLPCLEQTQLLDIISLLYGNINKYDAGQKL